MVDQFYIPVKSRKNRKFNRKQQVQEQEQQQKHDDCFDVGLMETNKLGNLSKENSNQLSKSVMGLSPFGKMGVDSSPSNLARFLQATVPSVPAQYFSKTTMKGWKTCDVEYQYYFTLGDLWESFRECSAYGAGVPLVLHGIDDGVVQYYVPYLSAIQLYGESSSFANGKPRQALEDSDGDDSKCSSSEGSSDYEFVEDIYSCASPQQTNNISFNGDGEGFSSDDSETENYRGQLLFQFFEQESPYSREPLANKVAELAISNPQLKTLRSSDLLPCSWMSVAWYPIYRIPSGSMVKDLDACFLTYHYLSMPLKGETGTHSPKLIHSNEADDIPKVVFPSFGLAAYKFKTAMWTRNGDNGCPLVNSLMLAADNWLRLLRVNHPDFEFFLSRGSYQR